MTVEELQKKTIAAEQKVEKCRKTIERHKKQMEKKAKQLRDMGVDPDKVDPCDYARVTTKEGNDIYWLLYDYRDKVHDFEGAVEKLQDAVKVLGNWQEKLDLQINRDKVIQDQVPEVIKNFLQDWKEKNFEWYIRRHARYLEVRADLRQQVREARIEAVLTLPELSRQKDLIEKVCGDIRNADDYHLINLWPRKPIETLLKEKGLDEKSISEKLSWIGDRTIYKMCEFRNEGERLEWLDKQLEAEKKAHMLWFVENVTRITGPIMDAQGLHISGGDLNGVVLGEKGAAKVITFSAGGWNVQRFHFRCKVSDVTEKYMSKAPASLDAQILSAIRIKKKPERENSVDHKDKDIFR